MELPAITFPSTGNFPPGATLTMSPRWTSSTTTCSSLTQHTHFSFSCGRPDGASGAEPVPPDDGVVRPQGDHGGVGGLQRHELGQGLRGFTLGKEPATDVFKQGCEEEESIMTK